MPYIGTASRPGQRYGETVDGYRRAAEDFNRFGAAARARGLRFYHHHHPEEFAVENGTRLYDVLLEETDPRLVFFEFEIFWSHVGQTRFPGFKPYEYPWNMPERFPLFHVKDGIDYSGTAAAAGPRSELLRLADDRRRRRRHRVRAVLLRPRHRRPPLHRRARHRARPGRQPGRGRSAPPSAATTTSSASASAAAAEGKGRRRR